MIICILIILLSSVIWSSYVFAAWVVCFFCISRLVCGMWVILSIRVTITISITNISFFCSWTIISVMANSMTIFLSFISLECFFPLMIFCQTTSIFILFSVIYLTHSFWNFSLITSDADSLCIKAINSWSTSPSFFLKYSLVVSSSISIL